MTWTLYGYILRELLKLLLMALAVLTVVMSFGSAIKPISDGLLGPWQIVKVIFYTMPGMLMFALPFACAFAGTLVFFRMSVENEVTACAVSGISYKELLAPVAALGLSLTLATFFLSNWVVPRFWGLVAQEIEQDLATVIVQKLKRREDVVIENVVIYADEAYDRQVIPGRVFEPGREPFNTLVLRGVAVGALDVHKGEGKDAKKEERVREDHTARLAVVDLYRDLEGKRTFVTMKLTDVSRNDPVSGTLVSSQSVTIDPIQINTPLRQKPKFLSLTDLRERASDPELSSDVREAKSDLASGLAMQELRDRIAEGLGATEEGEDGGDVGDVDGAGERRQVRLYGGAANQSHTISAPVARRRGARVRLESRGGEMVTVRIQNAGGVTTRLYEARSATIDVDSDTVSSEPYADVELREVSVIDPSRQTTAQHTALPISNLRIGEDLYRPLTERRLDELLAVARDGSDRTLGRQANKLRAQVASLVLDIKALMHERAAVAVNTSLVLLLGCVMSMLLRHQMPLVIFLWSFLPAVVAFLTISTGQNMLAHGDVRVAAGVGIIWGANAALLALVAGVYLRLRRH